MITDWVTYKQQKLISHTSRDWEIQDKSAWRLGVRLELASWFTGNIFLLCSHMVKGDKKVSNLSFPLGDYPSFTLSSCLWMGLSNYPPSCSSLREHLVLVLSFCCPKWLLFNGHVAQTRIMGIASWALFEAIWKQSYPYAEVGVRKIKNLELWAEIRSGSLLEDTLRVNKGKIVF